MTGGGTRRVTAESREAMLLLPLIAESGSFICTVLGSVMRRGNFRRMYAAPGTLLFLSRLQEGFVSSIP